MYNTNTLAFAKLVKNNKLNTLRLLVTFDSTKKDKDGNIIITAKSAAYASGDLCSVTANADYKAQCIAKVLQFAQNYLHTNNIVLI